MTRSVPRPLLIAVLPWLAAALVWMGLIAPMRADQENRLAEQAQVRRDRLRAERTGGEALNLLSRIRGGLTGACRASTDPAALRQRTVAAAAGLPLSPLALSTTGGPGGGATIEAEGPKGAVLQLALRLGDPARGGFLRVAALRDKGPRWSVSLTTGAFEPFPPELGLKSAPCSLEPDPEAVPAADAPMVRSKPAVPKAAFAPAQVPVAAPAAVSAQAPPPAPFTLVAFLVSEGKSRVSLRVDQEVRMVGVGDVVGGWRCVSIDRDEGAVFLSLAGGQLTLGGRP